MQEHLKSERKLDHTVGGHVDSGEDYYTAAVREADEEIGLKNAELKKVATSYYSPERNTVHMFGIYECKPSSSWVFVPNEEVDTIYAREIAEVVSDMNSSPEKYTSGFINTMAKYLSVKNLPHKLELDRIRKNWDKL